MSIFVIGDTHLSFSSQKPMTVFRGWDDYVSRIKENWQRLVTEQDTVIINGDISWAMGLEEAKEDFSFLHSLNGEKIILKGNHDYWWNTVTKMEAFLKENELTSIKFLYNNAYKIGDLAIAGSRGWFYDEESEDSQRIILRECGRLQRSIDCAKQLGGELTVFLHYPPIALGKSCPEILEVLEKNGVKRCFYGHLHGSAIRGAFNGVRNGVKYQLTSADYLEFCPLFVV